MPVLEFCNMCVWVFQTVATVVDGEGKYVMGVRRRAPNSSLDRGLENQAVQIWVEGQAIYLSSRAQHGSDYSIKVQTGDPLIRETEAYSQYSTHYPPPPQHIWLWLEGALQTEAGSRVCLRLKLDLAGLKRNGGDHFMQSLMCREVARAYRSCPCYSFFLLTDLFEDWFKHICISLVWISI